jgi:hypothetical protein
MIAGTSPSGVQPFKAWGGAKVTVEWMEGGTDVGDPCQAKRYHGFNGLDGRVVATIPDTLQQPASPHRMPVGQLTAAPNTDVEPTWPMSP